MRKRLCLMLIVLFLAGCSMGRDFPTFPIEEIRPNVTTKREVYAAFGEPVEKGSDSGYETWTYYYYSMYPVVGLQSQKRLHVIFNRDGTVRNYSYSTN